MSENFKVDTGSLQSSAGRVGTQANDILDRINSVKNEVAQARSFWQGRANNQFDELMQRWNTNATKIQKDLEDTVAALNQAATEYAATEGQNASRFAG
jgi:WXG100 family type VII secretion target